MPRNARREQDRRPQPLPIRSALLTFVRTLVGIEPAELARRAGLAESTLRCLESGHDEVSREVLGRLTRLMGVAPDTLEDLLCVSEEIRDGRTRERWFGPVCVSAEEVLNARAFGSQMGKLARTSFRTWLLRAAVQEQAVRDREAARSLAPYLRGQKNLIDVVIADRGCHLWSVAEWLCQESIDTVARDRDRAAEYAAAALAVAERAPGHELFGQRLGGSCYAHLGNVLRVERDYQAADRTFEKAKELWNAGEGGDPYGLLDAGRFLGLEASLRREQGHFAAALRLLRDALPIATQKERPYLLLNYGVALEQIGDPESAIRANQEAVTVLPRNLLIIARFNIAANLCQLGRHQDAEAILPEIARLAVEQNSKDHHVRLRWLTGRVAAGLGRLDEARGRFSWAQGEFLELGCPYEAAVVSLDLAKIYLQQGETSKVKRLAREMAPTFSDVGVHLHAQAALRVFQEAAEREAATVEFVIRVLAYLECARQSPGLRFDLAG